MKKYLVMWVALALLLISGVASAKNPGGDIKGETQLVISAVNAGYTSVDGEGQNYDFVELYNTAGERVKLDGYRLEYINSTGKVSGSAEWPKGTELNAEYLVLGYAKSPQYLDIAKEYLYNFGSAGIASTTGSMRLYYGDKIVDEVCWGNAICEQNFYKFQTDENANMTVRRCIVDGFLEICPDGVNFEMAKYYPEIDESALVFAEVFSQCAGIVFSEIYSYFETDYAEQFVEIYNPIDDTVVLDGCRISYKNKLYELAGELNPQEYYVFQNENLKLTKNPSSSNEIALLDVDGSVATSVVYYYGQKRGTAFAWFENGWKQTYAPTRGTDNVWQEFRNCPVGKIINPQTGNCINFDVDEEPLPCPAGKFRNPETNRCRSYESIDNILKPCGDGEYRSPETNRCRKIDGQTQEIKPCEDGYERNLETNRCRKIRINNGANYGVEGGETITATGWLGYGAIGIVVSIGIGYVAWQFRDELKRGMMKLVKRERKK